MHPIALPDQLTYTSRMDSTTPRQASSEASYADLAAKATEEELEKFSYGQCMWFALATHQKTGWPIEVVFDEAGHIDHAWTRMPDGRTFDVAGPGGAEDFIIDTSAIRSVSLEELVSLAGETINDECVAEASQVIDRILPSRRRRPSF